MNNTIGISLQLSPTEVGQPVSVEGAIAGSACLDEGCLEGDQSYFENLFNAELAALSDDPLAEESIGISMLESLEEIENIEEFSELDIPVTVLKEAMDMLGQDEVESLDISELNVEEQKEFLEDTNNEVAILFQEAIDSLPESIKSLPLTPENKQFIQQQASALMLEKHPEIAAKIEHLVGTSLPLDGKALPELSQEFQMEIKDFSPQEEALDKLSISDESGLQEDVSVDIDEKLAVEAILNKNTVQTDGAPQKNSLETLTQMTGMSQNQASLNSSMSTASPVSTTLQLPTNPSPEQWGNALGDKVQWMINTKLESAELRIDPPSLGKMDVKIQLNDDGATILIQTQHAVTRDLVESSVHRLREILLESGHQNVDVDVSHKENFQAEQQFSENDTSSDDATMQLESSEEETESLAENIIAGHFSNESPRLDLFA